MRDDRLPPNDSGLCGPVSADAAVRLRNDQVDALFANVSLGVVASALSAAVLAGLMIRIGAPRTPGVIWAGCVVLGASGHLALRSVYRRRAGTLGRSPWLPRAFAAICLAEGLAWGWAPLRLAEGLPFKADLMVLAVALTMAVGSISVFSFDLVSWACFFVPTTVPYTVENFAATDPYRQASAVLMAMYVVCVGGLGVRAHRNFANLVDLRLRATDLAQRLAVEKEAAERANRAKSSFLAAASHDLRQPIHALGLFIGALRGVAMPAQGARLVEQIERSTQALDSLFNAILDISRLDAGVVEPAPVAFPLHPLIERITDDHAEEALAKGLELRCAPTRAVVRSDPILVERILRNLVSNAVKHTERGRVLVGCRKGSPLRVEVWDTGPGIAADLRDRVFEEYFQIGNPERDRAQGLGLGLAIVRRLTDLIGSTLVLRSTPGRGSCFSVTLPTASADEVPAPPAAIADGSPRGLIAVIDDEAAVLEAMDAQLAGWGHRTLLAASGEEALARLSALSARPDLIICDYRLRGGETGAAVIERLRARLGADIPAMLVTGDTAPDRIAQAQASGYPLLHKPVAKARLRAAIASQLART
jgi:signal transduction histidine kinase/ActR/RegA family two-component response regulator